MIKNAFLFGFFAACSQITHAVTMEELHELQKARYADSLKAPSDKDKGGRPSATLDQGSSSIVSASYGGPADPKEMRLTGLYGVGSDIEANIAYRGATVPLKLGMDLDGWVLTDIGERTVKLTKTTGGRAGKKGTTRSVTLRIANVIREFPATAPQYAPAPIPMPMPMPPAAAAPRRPLP